MSNPTGNEYPSLRSEQSADVILYYDEGENEVSRKNGWRDKRSLGQVALHTTDPKHSILPENEDGSRNAMLTYQEMNAGLNYIQEKESAPTPLPESPELRDDLPPNLTEMIESRYDELVDKEMLSSYHAWVKLAHEFPELFKPSEKNG